MISDRIHSALIETRERELRDRVTRPRPAGRARATVDRAQRGRRPAISYRVGRLYWR